MAQYKRDEVDFHLPDEILAVIPTDPYDLLDVARKITSMAIGSRVSRLESESARLRQLIADRDRTVNELQDKIARLDRIVQDSSSKLKIALDENDKLVKERDMLALTAKKLARNLAKLETFKKQLMQTLSEDNVNSESTNMQACNRPIARLSSWKDEISRNDSSSDLASSSTITRDSTQNGNWLSLTPYMTPLLTTSSSSITVGLSPRGISIVGSSPHTMSGPTSPTKSLRYQSSQYFSAPTSPPQRHSSSARPRMDGKEFFRQARTRLSYEQFGAFLANIKEFNSNRQSREVTLEKAEEIFGTDNKDLFMSFQNMLNRSLT